MIGACVLILEEVRIDGICLYEK